jgi:S1-C subfamily serine protease
VIVTRGIVEGLERRLGRPAWVKTDAWIAPGHSGGPMLDEQGRLVAVSAATLGSTESLGRGVPVALLPAEWRARITEDLR